MLLRSSICRSSRLLIALFILTVNVLTLALFFTVASPVQAAGMIEVTILEDEDPIGATDGNCSLREAISAANTDSAVDSCAAGSGPDFITFSGGISGGVIVLSATLNVNTPITITGPIEINGNGSERMFTLASSNSDLTLVNLTLRDGFTSGAGGAVSLSTASAKLTTLSVNFTENSANGDGGAINSGGILNIVGSSFISNTADAEDDGTGSGGAIYTTGSDPIFIGGTVFTANTAGEDGGAIHRSGSSTGDPMDIQDAIFALNVASGEDTGGGAIFNAHSSPMNILRSVFQGNVSNQGPGGAIYNNINATLVITDSAFEANESGGISLVSGKGGAIYNEENLTITRAFFATNASLLDGDGGAIYNDKVGIAQVSNSTFYLNGAGIGRGGAIFNTDSNNLVSDSTVSLINVTLADNQAMTGTALFNDDEAITLVNTIVANGSQPGGLCAATSDSPPVADSGYNLDNADSCELNATGSLTTTDPMLESPGFNGGALATLFTMALKPASPALDAADNATCAADPVSNVDQRGEPRPLDGDAVPGAVCDMGAYEYDPGTTAITLSNTETTGVVRSRIWTVLAVILALVTSGLWHRQRRQRIVIQRQST